MPHRRRSPNLAAHAAAILALAVPSASFAQQATGAAYGSTPPPSCAELGRRTFAVIFPPDQTAEEVLQTLGSANPDAWFGVELHLQPTREPPKLLNGRRVASRLGAHLQRMVNDGWTVSGEVRAVLLIDEEGRVENVSVQSGNARLDRMIKDVWKRSRFEPAVVYGECRTRLSMVAPFSFAPGESGRLSVCARYTDEW